MLLSPSTYVLWVAATLLEALACVLALRHGLHRRLPIFTGYLLLVAVREVAWWWGVHVLGYASRPTFYLFWVGQAVLVCARGLTIAELCHDVLRPYRGVWALGRRLLQGSAVLLLVYAGVATQQGHPWITTFILRGERGLELAAVGSLVLLLLICRYYEIRLNALQKMVALGLGWYSVVQVANNTFLAEWLSQYFGWWNVVRSLSFQVALAIWCVALRRPLPGKAPAPELLSEGAYDRLTPQVNYRLRILNERLLEILKS